jgi:hypothetical protein
MSYRLRRFIFIFGAAIYFSFGGFIAFLIGFPKKMGPDWLDISWLGSSYRARASHSNKRECMMQQTRGKTRSDLLLNGRAKKNYEENVR